MESGICLDPVLKALLGADWQQRFRSDNTSCKNPVKIRAVVERMKQAIAFPVSAVNHSPETRQKTDSGIGVRNGAAIGVGLGTLQ